MRSIEIHIPEEFKELNLCPVKVQAAIGRLAMWAFGSERYHSVQIYGDRYGSLIGVYRNKEKSLTYNLAAILNEANDYGFHS